MFLLHRACLLSCMQCLEELEAGVHGRQTVPLTSKTPCSSFPVKEDRIEARTPQWKRLSCSIVVKNNVGVSPKP